MSESELPNAESSEFYNVDDIIQRKWDEFAIADFAVEHESPNSTKRAASSNADNAAMSLKTLSTHDSPTALGDAFSKAESPHITDREYDSPDEQSDDQHRSQDRSHPTKTRKGATRRYRQKS